MEIEGDCEKKVRGYVKKYSEYYGQTEKSVLISKNDRECHAKLF